MWLPQYTKEIEKIFHHRAARRLSDMLREARLNAEDRGKPYRRSCLECVATHWASEDFKKVFERHKTNRASEKGGSLHTGGSVNTAHTATLGTHIYIKCCFKFMKLINISCFSFHLLYSVSRCIGEEARATCVCA